MIDIIEEIFHHGFHDTIKMLPFLLAAFLVIEAMEHYSGNVVGKFFERAGKAGPVIGALAGCVPQCGFSVMAANLYAGGVVTVGTLVATFIATSDEAVLIILGNPGYTKEVVTLLVVKVIIGIISGYIANVFLRSRVSSPKTSGVLCKDCGCHEHDAGIIKPAIRHTLKIYVYLFLVTVALNLAIELIGVEELSKVLLSDSFFQPVIAAIIGFIPNCAASVILTQLYLSGVISFASVVAGLCTGAGVGLIVLFQVNKNRKENFKIVGILFATATISGILLEILGNL